MRASPVHDEFVDLDVALADGAALAWLYRNGEVLSRRDEGDVAHLQVGLAEQDLSRFERRRGPAAS